MCSLNAWGYDILKFETSFQKNYIGWPQQPSTEKEQKFKIIFHDSTKNFFFQNIKNKAEFKNLDDSEVLSSNFPGLGTSATSLTSAASAASLASTTSTAQFHQRTSWKWWLKHSWHQNYQYCSLYAKWIIKNPIVHWYLISFLLEAVEASLCYFFEHWLQISKCHNLRHLENTLYSWNYQIWYLSEPIYFIYFNMRHPVQKLFRHTVMGSLDVSKKPQILLT